MKQTLRASVYALFFHFSLCGLLRFIAGRRRRSPRQILSFRPYFGVWGLAAFALLVIVPAEAEPPDHVKIFIGFDRTPGTLEQTIVTAVGGSIHYSYTIVPSIAATVPEAAVVGLLRNPRVTGVESVRSVRAIEHSSIVRVPELEAAWGVEHIGSGAVHVSGNEGSSVLIAVIDTGIDCGHLDLSCAATGYDFSYGDDDPADGDGHGTHVAGSVAAVYNNGFGVVGVAPQAGLVPLKVLDDNGNGDWADVVAALEWISIYNGTHDPDILVTNHSYTDPGDPGTTVTTAFQNLYDQGVLHVAAAGNSGKLGRFNTMGFPARLSSVMAVAATDEKNARASFSSVGNEMEIAAPGVNINSTLPGDGHGLKSGTSMASPHVAGVAALVIAAGITGPDAVRQRLQNTADDLGRGGWDGDTGYGLVDADEAAGVTGDPPSNQPPTASFSYNCTELTCTFDASDSSDNDGSLVSYDWGFGDGSTGSGETSSHTYADAGTFTVSLIVTDDGGLSGTDTQNVTVSIGGTITLTGAGYKVRGLQKVDLSWSGAASDDVIIYRDNALIATTENVGTYTDNLDSRGGGSYVYEICEAVPSGDCSNPVTVNF